MPRAPLRFIPARAGNTPTRRAKCSAAPVHPRAGGEHFSFALNALHDAGSSPRGRGTLRRVQRHEFGERFIPARAGNTCSLLRGLLGLSVHPRAGGEHCHAVGGLFLVHGSSPRGRGTPPGPRRRPRRARFIPARAGNTRRSARRGWPGSVHPRAGGEHSSLTAVTAPSSGSSPRGRGTHRIRLFLSAPLRFIPARAGNTRSVR